MPNALDTVRIRYGQKSGESKTISYLEFLKLDASFLSEKELQVKKKIKRELINRLYQRLINKMIKKGRQLLIQMPMGLLQKVHKQM